MRGKSATFTPILCHLCVTHPGRTTQDSLTGESLLHTHRTRLFILEIRYSVHVLLTRHWKITPGPQKHVGGVSALVACTATSRLTQHQNLLSVQLTG